MVFKWLRWIFPKAKARVTPTAANETNTPAPTMKRKSKRFFRSRRRRPEQSTTNLPELIVKEMAVTLKELECPICTNTCTPPIYSCENGHLICSICRSTTSKCPTCSENYLTTRNVFAEQFIQKYSKPCKYARDGCTYLKWKGCEMKSHEMSCFYRPVQCIVPSCEASANNEAIQYRLLLQHLIDTHRISGCSRLPVSITFQTESGLATFCSDRQWLPYHVKAYECDFYLMMEVRRPYFWSWVWVHPPKLPLLNVALQNLLPPTSPSPFAGYGENFIFISTIELRSDEKFFALKWVGPVHSIRTPASAIIQEGLCLGGAEACMQHFETNEKVLNVTLNIEKKSLNNGSSSNTDGDTRRSRSRRSRSKSRSRISFYNEVTNVVSQKSTTSIIIEECGLEQHSRGRSPAATTDQNNNTIQYGQYLQNQIGSVRFEGLTNSNNATAGRIRGASSRSTSPKPPPPAFISN